MYLAVSVSIYAFFIRGKSPKEKLEKAG